MAEEKDVFEFSEIVDDMNAFFQNHYEGPKPSAFNLFVGKEHVATIKTLEELPKALEAIAQRSTKAKWKHHETVRIFAEVPPGGTLLDNEGKALSPLSDTVNVKREPHSPVIGCISTEHEKVDCIAAGFKLEQMCPTCKRAVVAQ